MRSGTGVQSAFAELVVWEMDRKQTIMGNTHGYEHIIMVIRASVPSNRVLLSGVLRKGA